MFKVAHKTYDGLKSTTGEVVNSGEKIINAGFTRVNGFISFVFNDLSHPKGYLWKTWFYS